MVRMSIVRKFSEAILGLLVLASLSNAYGYKDLWGWSGSDNSRSGLFDDGWQGGRGGRGSSRDPLNMAAQFLGFDIDHAKRIRLIHGVLAALAFVFLFPVGAITIRIIPSRAAIWIHATMQILAYMVYIAAFGLGVYLVRLVRLPSFNLLEHHHPIIGIVVFALLFFQPILGIIHHRMFKKYGRRQVWSYAHLWLGRSLLTLGIINGGLGLRLANNTRSGEIAYGVVAGVMGLLWLAAAIYGERKRHTARKSKAKGGSAATSTAGDDPSVTTERSVPAPPYSETTGYYGTREKGRH